MGWIVFFAVILAPSLIGLAFAVRAARRVGRAERAMRALAARPGWRLVERDEGGARWAGYAVHFPWLLRARDGTAVAGPLGEHRVTVGRFVENLTSKTDAHWLVVVFDVPGSRPHLRLERGWSAAELGLTFPLDAPYLPMSEDRAGTTERFYASELPERLVRLAGPAVSVTKDGVCFVHHPLPHVVDMDRLLEGLAGMLPDLLALAGDGAPDA
ncbi:hypothetical protein E2C00_03700 [Streptomyces sp. WAC05374]|uniref:hypothetical protein n=1 Tax=Streptomyces sp. WAC05374 TaxID=2487420 RepID=UPI000F865694|nr:hypothetical protein [Streptomyces sp. WAC05374]RST19015.1 hypothetical protein EF905_03130 [Streptomyces sp. WAC05374]TDF50589.1 hypothetical protein E2B92_03685 [Streptomyces sp. WAC05374]TDF56878.1 hypothetical protein E2C02_10495 [Streptomyces sp. WAC05374]TDF60841.1 hypothetical protein E2C00_03700 [Streptomyces sp. WAC05374]